MELELIKNLNESRSFRSTYGMNKLKYDDVTGFFYLSNLLLYLYKIEGDKVWSSRYANKTKLYGSFNKARYSETDLYMLAFTLAGNNDHYIHDGIVEKKSRFDQSKFKAYLSAIANSSTDEKYFERYFFNIEREIRMDNGMYRGYRRMAFRWDSLDTQERSSLISNIEYYIKRYSTVAEILDPIESIRSKS